MEDLITYCGVYCGYCARWKDSATLARLATAMAELVDTHGFHYWMPGEVKEFDYNEFGKALDFFSKKDSWLICYKGCRHGDGRPNCEIRDCCKEHGLYLCFECSEFPCDMVKENERMLERAREYNELGKEKWIQQQAEKAEKGYEHHTKKYYRHPLSKPEDKI